MLNFTIVNKKMGVKFGWYYKMAYLCTALKQNAEIAQLVEHRSPKPGVGSSSLSSRANIIEMKKVIAYIKESYDELVHKGIHILFSFPWFVFP